MIKGTFLGYLCNIRVKEVEKPDKKSQKKIYGELEFHVEESKVLVAEQYDGFYMIESSNKAIQGKEAVSQYKPNFHLRETRLPA